MWCNRVTFLYEFMSIVVFQRCIIIPLLFVFTYAIAAYKRGYTHDTYYIMYFYYFFLLYYTTDKKWKGNTKKILYERKTMTRITMLWNEMAFGPKPIRLDIHARMPLYSYLLISRDAACGTSGHHYYIRSLYYSSVHTDTHTHTCTYESARGCHQFIEL